MPDRDQQVRIVATARLRPEMRAGFLGVAAAFVVATRRAEGCIAYDILASVTDPCALTTIERWTDRSTAMLYRDAPQTMAFEASLAMASDGTPRSVTLLNGGAETLA